MSIVIITPPQWFTDAPPVASGYIYGFLKKQNLPVKQYDFNIELYDYLMSRNQIEYCEKKINQYVSLKNKFPSIDKEEFEKLTRCLQIQKLIPYVASEIEGAKAIYRSNPRDNNLEDYRKAFRTIMQAYKILTACYYPLQMTDRCWKTGGKIRTLQDILNPANSGILKPFDGFFKRLIHERIPGDSDIIGFSITTSIQLVFAIRIMKQMKKILKKKIHYTFGGYLTKQLFNDYRKTKKIFRHFDSIVFFDGEHALCDLYQYVTGAKKVTDCRNLGYVKNGKVNVNTPVHLENLDTLPPPDYDGLPLDKYFSHKIIIPVVPARGCYYNRCAFCNYNNDNESLARTESPHTFVDRIALLKKKYNSPYFMFCMSALLPKRLLSICREINKRGLKIYWIQQNRIDRAFSGELCRELARSGCVRIEIGAEHGSAVMLERMNKKINLGHLSRTIRRLRKENIYVWLNFIYGFPGETLHDLDLMFDFIDKHLDFIFGFVISLFDLVPYSPVFNNPKLYNMKISLYDDKKNFYFDPVKDIKYTSRNNKSYLAAARKSIKTFYARLMNEDNFVVYDDSYMALKRTLPEEIYTQMIMSEKGIPQSKFNRHNKRFPEFSPRWGKKTLYFDKERFRHWKMKTVFCRVEGKRKSIRFSFIFDRRRTVLYNCDETEWKLLNRFDGQSDIKSIFPECFKSKNLERNLYLMLKNWYNHGILTGGKGVTLTP